MNDQRTIATCTACGAPLSSERASAGLCLGCLMELALESPSLMEEIEDQADAPTLDAGDSRGFVEGQVLGNRFRVRSLLGRGGMGEVWRAVDLKLRVDVALKALRPELLSDERALESLRQEVRVAREVISPNVCRVFDLVELENRELVSMEYIDGITLLDILRTRAPLDLTEAREVAAQFLAGLEAIHQAGLVHRDVKPENLMVTRSGRVVLMDFGIAKGLAEGRTGTVSGTPAYMAPEQGRGEAPDARADVFSAGIVLTEMVAPGGMASFEERRAIWKGVHAEPPKLPDSPWKPVLAAAVARIPEQRPASASALARALEEVTLRADRAEDVTPYPGLASFSQRDAQFFFGRELEVEEMWKKLRRPQIYGLIGPSGAGKSSFLRAGLLAVVPTGWSAVVACPGNRPLSNLGRALVPELSGDTEALQLLVNADDPDTLSRIVGAWRGRHEQTLLILDQFEELFTLNPPEIQERFADLVAHLALELDVHVLLSMRDDFLFYCSEQPALSPMFSELTPLRAPSGAALRRALVQPALKCGYRFEDDSLVDEMLEEVGRERGALPMLAFAAARLWEFRDRETGRLTREAYAHTGGVAGALAQHAERTLERVGKDNIPVARELFRNLVTAQGTRAARAREELLSVFEREEATVAEDVLSALVDARLLTAYEVPAEDEEEAPRQRIEIVHESLLSKWPRLVRWQTQDREGALLRDQLRQVAQMWVERGHPEDLLWTGTSYNEYELWRERYSGGLSAAEGSFVRAMASHAERRRRQRRLAVAAVITVLSVGLGVVGAFWRQAASARDQAEEERLRAEGHQLLALGRLEFDASPTSAFAYALASLERADDPAAKAFALDILAQGPLPFVLGTDPAHDLDFSADGKWLAVSHASAGLKLWPSAGGEPRLLRSSEGPLRGTRFGPDSNVVASLDYGNDIVQIQSIPSGDVIRAISPAGDTEMRLMRSSRRLFTFSEQGDRTRIQSWPLDGAEPELLADLDLGLAGWYPRNFAWGLDIDPAGGMLAYIPFDGQNPGGSVYARLLSALESAPKLIARHPDPVLRARFHPDGRRLASGGLSGGVRIWDLEGNGEEPRRVLRKPPGYVIGLAFDTAGSRLVAASSAAHLALWDLDGPPDAEPMLLADAPGNKVPAFHPRGEWLAAASSAGVKAWPVGRRDPITLKGHENLVRDLAFLPDGRSLVSVSHDGTMRLWPLWSAEADRGRVLLDVGPEFLVSIAIDPSGSQALASSPDRVYYVPLDGGEARELATLRWPSTALGKTRATAIGEDAGRSVLRIWNLETGESEDHQVGDDFGVAGFSIDGELIALNEKGFGKWSPADGGFEDFTEFSFDPSKGTLSTNEDCRLLLAGNQGENGEAMLYDLETGTSLQLDSHGPGRCGQLDPDGEVVVTYPCEGEGPLLVGPTGAGPVHRLASSGSLSGFAFSPNNGPLDGRWIAATDGSDKIRLWPLPDFSSPSLHTLPHDDLLAKLRALTNVRVVADRDSTTGWSLDREPFPGWEEVPRW